MGEMGAKPERIRFPGSLSGGSIRGSPRGFCFGQGLLRVTKNPCNYPWIPERWVGAPGCERGFGTLELVLVDGGCKSARTAAKWGSSQTKQTDEDLGPEQKTDLGRR